MLVTNADYPLEAMGQLYVKVAFPPESKAKMEELVKNLSIAFRGFIETK